MTPQACPVCEASLSETHWAEDALFPGYGGARVSVLRACARCGWAHVESGPGLAVEPER